MAAVSARPMAAATLLGGTASDQGSSVKVDASGNIYLTGSTASNFAGHTNAGGTDAFVTKLDSSGNPLWTSFLSGAGNDRAIRVDHRSGQIRGRGLRLSKDRDGRHERDVALPGLGMVEGILKWSIPPI